MNERRSHVDGPRPVPFLGWRGNALAFFRNPVDYMLSLRADYGPVAALTTGVNEPLFFRREDIFASPPPKRQTVFVSGPEANKTVLSQLDVFETRRPRGPKTAEFHEIAENVLFANGEDHKRRRKLLMPIFTRGHLQAYHGQMADLTRRAMARWSTGEVIDFSEEMSLLSMHIASKCLYGMEPAESDAYLAARMRKMIHTMFSPAALVPLRIPGTPYWRLQRDLRRILDILRARVHEVEKSDAGGDDVLSLMVSRHLEETGEVDVEEIVGEAFVMFFAGHDTTAKALSWTLYLLAQHPQAARALMEEMDAEVEEDAPTYEQTFELPVLDRTVKESMRLLSPAIMFPRVAVRDTELGGYEIPAGTEVVYSSYVTHMDPEIFPEPRRFDPDRWIDFKPGPYEYLPFGAGRRTCLGAALGTLTVKLLVPMILKRHRLEVLSGTRVDLDTNVVMGPKPGLPLRVREQDRDFDSSPAAVEGYLARMVASAPDSDRSD